MSDVFVLANQIPVQSSGAPYGSAKLYFYRAGTTTQQNVYTTAALSVAHDQPVQADTAGVFPPIFLNRDASFDYRYQLKTSADVLIKDVDNYPKNSSPTQAEFDTYIVNSARIKYDLTAAESVASVMPTNYYIPSHDILGYVHAARYGCSTANTNNATAINNAILVAKAAQTSHGESYGMMTVRTGVGIFDYSSQIALSGANTGIILSGELSSLQQGSQRPASTLRWTGGASATILSTVTYNEFHNFAFENAGTALCAVRHSDGGHAYYKNCSVQGGASGFTAYSLAIIDITQPVDYCILDRCEFSGGAPVMINYDGASSGSQSTSFQVFNGIFDEITDDQTFLKVTNGSFEMISFHHTTFNHQTSGKLFTVIDLSSIGSFSCGSIGLHMVEFDHNSPPAANRFLKLKNVRNFHAHGGSWACGSAVTAAVSLTATTVTAFESVEIHTLNGPVFEFLDAVSQVFPGRNYLQAGNTQDLTSNTSGISGIVDVTYAASMGILGHLGHPLKAMTYKVDVTDNSNMTFFVANYAGSPPNQTNWTRGQQFWVRVRNTSGGVMGTVTFDSSFKTSGAFTVPANGFSRAILFEYNGSVAVELMRGAADVAN